MKRWLPLLMLLLPALAHAQSYVGQGNSATNSIVGSGTLTVTVNTLPYGTTSFTPSCPNVAYVGRSQVNWPNFPVLQQPSGSTTGDFEVAWCTGFNSAPFGPAGWTPVTGASDQGGDFSGAWTHVIQTGDPQSWTWTSASANWGSCVMRGFRGISGIDSFATIPATAATDNTGAIVTFPALPSTTHACEEYTVYVAQRGAAAQVTSLGGLLENNAGNAVWSTLEGNQIFPTQGTVATANIAGAYSSVPNQWTGVEMLLHP